MERQKITQAGTRMEGCYEHGNERKPRPKMQSTPQRTTPVATTELANIKEPLEAASTQPRIVKQKLRGSEDRPRRCANELEQQLISSNRQLCFGEMLASFAHELSNSLQIIVGFTQDVLSSAKFSQPHHEDLKIVEKEALRCSEMIRNFLNLARPTPPDLVLSTIEPIIRNSLTLAQGYQDKSRIEVEVKLQPVLPQIRANSNQVHQALMNLFFNAADAMPEGGTLTLRAATSPVDPALADENSPRELKIAVSDTGVGMNPDTLSKVFEPFFSTKPSKGMGLGLSICDRIVKAHGGRITVESKPGVGTTFYFHFPVPNA